MEVFEKIVVLELEYINKRLVNQSRINTYLMKQLKKDRKHNIITGITIGILGYSIYIQASKIEFLKKEIEELKSEKGE